MSILSGFIYDLLGRRWTLFFYFIVAAVMGFLTPLSARNSYGSYFVVRVLYGMAFIAITANPLINDYIRTESRGRAHAIMNFG
jgi:MFS family permease